MIKIKIKKLYLDTVLPKKGSKHAACYDVVAREIIKNDDLVTVKLGFATDIPNGYKGVIVPRSSFTQKGWVMQNSPGQIDSDYRGELKVILINLSDTTFVIEKGLRIAQMVLCPVIRATLKEVETLEDTKRGSGGFGSTGTN